MSYLEGKRILVVDDEPGIRELFVAELNMQGCECLEAESGKVAFEMYKQNKFDAIVSDIRMPNGDGMFLLQNILQLGDPTSFLVFITGYSDLPIEEFYERGADLVVQKPFEIDVVVKMIEDNLQSPRTQWRQMVRMVTRFPVEVTWDDGRSTFNTMTVNFSRRGMFIAWSGEFPDVSSMIDLKIPVKTASGAKTFTGSAIVRWVRKENKDDRPCGLGVEFQGMSSSLVNELCEMIGFNYIC
jgi:CheY-like chemotaxis protein